AGRGGQHAAQDADCDEQDPAAGGHARLALVLLAELGLDHLARAAVAQQLDEPGEQDHRDDERHHERDGVERQGGHRANSGSTSVSRKRPWAPLTRTRSPGRARCATHSAAAALSATRSAPDSAASTAPRPTSITAIASKAARAAAPTSRWAASASSPS